MSTLRGFGFTFDVERGTTRQWYMGADGIQRWADNDKPVVPDRIDPEGGHEAQ